jgi:hypothetical protein
VSAGRGVMEAVVWGRRDMGSVWLVVDMKLRGGDGDDEDVRE